MSDNEGATPFWKSVVVEEAMKELLGDLDTPRTTSFLEENPTD